MATRRDFLRHISQTGLFAFGAGGVPSCLSRAAQLSDSHNVLLVIFLKGGNDGLNTIVPYRDPLYARLRPHLHIPASSVLRINDDIGLHPALRDLADLWNDGRLKIVQGVGYPNHLRSHFESTAIWHAGQLTARPNANDGWLGRALDRDQSQHDSALAIALNTVETPELFRGRTLRTSSPAECSPQEAAHAARLLMASRSRTATVDELHQTIISMRRDAAQMLQRWSEEFVDDRFTKAASLLDKQLRQAARLIAADVPARVYYLEHSATDGNGGYDTHAAQRQPHGQLLRELGSALKSFVQQLQTSGDANRVTVIVFSEFGRRAAENDSGGTDHGAAGPVLLVGNTKSGNVIGPRPDLENLDDGDVAVSIDFRSVYAELLRDVLHVNARPVLGADFAALE